MVNLENSVIKVLDEHTIDKIAAGEVVERPSSVVKELVENAIDAGSSAITVEIKDGGISYIRVSDNGKGIPADQIRTAFMRHATSKITSAIDLMSISSLGFRGEALSSIAAVSQVELFTKTNDDVFGIRYCIEGSKEKIFEEAGLPNGTSFIVRNLFFNTPARKKFLKTSMTEGSYITEYIERVMLSHTEIAFKLIINGQVKLQSYGSGDLKDVIYSLYGRDIVNNIVPVKAFENGIVITGYVGKPQIARSNHTYEIYFVNHRYIKSSLIKKALDEAYKPYLMLHKYPFAVFEIELPPDKIDVNVHPTKMEVRFLEAQNVYSLLVSCIQNALMEKELIPDVSDKSDIKAEIPIKMPEPFEQKRIDSIKEIIKSEPQRNIDSELKSNIITNNIPDYSSISEQEHTSKPLKEEAVYTLNEIQKTTQLFEQQVLFDDDFLNENNIKKHRIIGQLFDTYWLVEMESKLYIIDQHAAHEKVNYERLIKQLHNNSITMQQINPPVIISLSRNEEELLINNMEAFATTGFEIEKFGGHEYSLRAVPTDLYGMSAKEYFLDLLDLLSNEHLSNDLSSVCDKIASMACKSAVKGNHKMSVEEAHALIDELLTLDNPYNCPHGRPTIISYTKYEVEKMFKRIV